MRETLRDEHTCEFQEEKVSGSKLAIVCRVVVLLGEFNVGTLEDTWITKWGELKDSPKCDPW